MHQKKLHLLQILLDATRQKQLIWRSDSVSGFHARFVGLRCTVRFRYVVAAQDHEPDPSADFVEVTVGMASLKFFSGTEGFSLAQEIIASAYPELSDEYVAGCKQMDELLARLKNSDGATQPKRVF